MVISAALEGTQLYTLIENGGLEGIVAKRARRALSCRTHAGLAEGEDGRRAYFDVALAGARARLFRCP